MSGRRRPQRDRKPGAPKSEKKSLIWILENGHPRAIAVKTGVTDGTSTEIKGEGIKAGIKVLTDTVKDKNDMKSVLIAFEKVSRIYGSGSSSVTAMQEITLQIRAGEFLAVMGPSGSGKSTCMNLLGCLDTPSAGIYRFLDVDVGKLSRDQRALCGGIIWDLYFRDSIF